MRFFICPGPGNCSHILVPSFELDVYDINTRFAFFKVEFTGSQSFTTFVCLGVLRNPFRNSFDLFTLS